MAKSEGSRRATIIVLIVIMVAALGVAGFSIVDSNIRTAEDRESQSILNQMQSEVYDLMIIAQEAAAGDENALFILPDLKNQILGLMAQFNASEDEIEDESRGTLTSQINIIAENIDLIESQTENVLFLYDQLAILEANIPQIQQAYTNIVDTMLQAESPSDQVAEAQAQVWRAERLLTSLNRILAGSDNAVAAAEQFRQDVLVFNQVLVGMQEGNLIMGITRVESPEARLLLEQVDGQFSDLNQSIESVISASPALGQISQASSVILDTAASLLQSTTLVSEEISALADNIEKRPLSTAFTTLLAASVVVFVLFVLGVQIYFNTRKNLVTTEDTNERNQEAILRLLDEIADLGEGDLTVHATVTEDFTGAIADSINYAIEQLRELVARVATTAESVAASSNETRATSLRLSEASEHQAVQIANASSAINEISENLSKVSENAEQLANTAQRSVTVARNGASVVQNTIEGMNNIREQIQDTSKRIKRLGESSQEIGDIVSLINEIADQTNILALNASIQAAMAGEAGRGFAVVADEVQGLAERAAASTRQIENLVKTIQSDTNEAVASMEQTTAEVVRGAQLANNAGNALNDIQTTSENLATLILAIAKETQNQSQSAESIVGSMRVIQDISAQTLEGTTESARAVGELSEQADELRQSIADFKLPDSMQPESIPETDDDDLEMGVDDMSFVDDETQGANSQNATGIYEDEMIFEEDTDASVESPETASYEGSDDDADIDVEFVDDQDINKNTQTPEAAAGEESFDGVDFSDFDSDDMDIKTETSSLEVEESDESDDFEATMIMEAADLEIDDDQLDQDDTSEETKSDSGKADKDEDEEDLDFSFDDEDFLSFDLDEEKKK